MDLWECVEAAGPYQGQGQPELQSEFIFSLDDFVILYLKTKVKRDKTEGLQNSRMPLFSPSVTEQKQTTPSHKPAHMAFNMHMKVIFLIQ